MCDTIIATMRSLMDQGDYSKAASAGERLAIESYSAVLSPQYFALLAAAHLGAGSFAAARLTVVRGVAESGDRTLDFLSRLLGARHEGRTCDAVNALKSAPQDIVEIFRDILVCEAAYTAAATYSGSTIKRVCDQCVLSEEEVQGCIARKGKHFGVDVAADGKLKRLAVSSSSSSSRGGGDEQKTSADAAPAATGAKQASSTSGIASVELITEAALMTAQPVDRYWKNPQN